MKLQPAKKYISLIILSFICSACVVHKPHRAPVVELTDEGNHSKQVLVIEPVRAKTEVPITPATAPIVELPKAVLPAGMYEVQKGDTLYSIAFAQGVDFHELVALNHLENPSAIQVGQRLQIPAAGAAKILSVKKTTAPMPPTSSANSLKTQPLALKIPYSESAVVEAPPASSAVVAVSKPAPVTDTDESGDDTIDWTMPTHGKILAGFSDSANRKGVDIAGKTGQAILASAAGKVVYSGNGLRGYGKLIIIKHNKIFLSAYAHNDKILVTEGQLVKKGQKIGEMGNSDTDQTKLHFEIRKLGKPVDPVQYLPALKS